MSVRRCSDDHYTFHDGYFEQLIPEIAQILHAKGALLYMDAANMTSPRPASRGRAISAYT